MANNREISQFAGLVTVNDTTNQVSIASTLGLSGGGRLGIGTNNPQANLHIFEGTGSTQAPANSGNNLVLDGSSEVGLSLLFGTDVNTAYGNIYWGNSTDGDADGRITYFGSTYATASDRQSMQFRTAGTERLRITSDGYLRLAGAGIQFNGDTAAANALDDYEEGTWTPTYASGLASGTITNAAGLYTKIGRTVTVQASMNFTAGAGTASLSARLVLGGLPFSSASVHGGPTVGGENNFGGELPWDVSSTRINGSSIYINATSYPTPAQMNRLDLTATYIV